MCWSHQFYGSHHDIGSTSWHRWPQEWSVAVVSISPVLLSSSMISNVFVVRVAWRMSLLAQHLFSLWVTGIQPPEFSQIIVVHSMNLISSVLSTIVCCYLWLFSSPLQYIAVYRLTASHYPFGYFQTFRYQR